MNPEAAMSESPRRFPLVDACRFLCAAVIFVYHFRWYSTVTEGAGYFSGGYLAVEFFFLVSGFLLMRHVDTHAPGDRSPEEDAAGYLFSRYRRLWPLYFMGVYAVGWNAIHPDFGIADALRQALPEVAAVQVFWQPYEINGHLWFVSALIWASFPVYYLARKRRRPFTHVIAPLTTLVWLALVWRRFGYINLTSPDALFPWGFLRAFAQIGLGCTLYELSRLIAKKALHPAVLTAVRLALTAAVAALFWAGNGTTDGFAAVFVLALWVLSLFAGDGLFGKFLSRPAPAKICAFLGSLSYGIYLFQAAAQLTLAWYLPPMGFWPIVGVGLLVVAAAAFLFERGFAAVGRGIGKLRAD